MDRDVLIRPEREEEFDLIYHLTKAAFETAAHRDGDEQDFVNDLRARGNYIPELALVAEVDGAPAGHMMLTRTWITDERGGRLDLDVLLLAPLSVLPEHQRRGVGAALVEAGFARARGLGYRAVFLLGDPAYYHRFGFVAASHFGLRCSVGLPPENDENCMARELVPGALGGVSGTVFFDGH